MNKEKIQKKIKIKAVIVFAFAFILINSIAHTRMLNQKNEEKLKASYTAEFDFIHLVRHNPGMTQADVRAALKMDKGAAARRAARLEAKGYLVRKPHVFSRHSN